MWTSKVAQNLYYFTKRLFLLYYNLLASRFFSSVSMDVSTISIKAIEAIWVQHFLKDKFVEGGEPVHIAEPPGVSLNAWELEECLVDSFKLLDL